MDTYTYYALFFGLFFFLFYKPLAKGVRGFLDEKITEIKWEIESSLNSKEDLEKELNDLKKDMPFVERQHKEMLESAKKEIDEVYKSRCEDFKVTLKFSEKNSLKRIEQTENRAIANVKSEMLGKSLQIISNYFADQKNSDLDLAIVTNAFKRQRR